MEGLVRKVGWTYKEAIPISSALSHSQEGMQTRPASLNCGLHLLFFSRIFVPPKRRKVLFPEGELQKYGTPGIAADSLTSNHRGLR